jgi:hypothetical protein
MRIDDHTIFQTFEQHMTTPRGLILATTRKFSNKRPWLGSSLPASPAWEEEEEDGEGGREEEGMYRLYI